MSAHGSRRGRRGVLVVLEYKEVFHTLQIATHYHGHRSVRIHGYVASEEPQVLLDARSSESEGFFKRCKECMDLAFYSFQEEVFDSLGIGKDVGRACASPHEYLIGVCDTIHGITVQHPGFNHAHLLSSRLHDTRRQLKQEP